MLAIVSRGQLAELPDWYPRIKAAKYLGVPPDWFEDKWEGWQDWALMAEKGEAEARHQLRLEAEAGADPEGLEA